MISSRPQTTSEVGAVEDEDEKRGAALEKALSSSTKYARHQKRKKSSTPEENEEETCVVAKKATVRTRRRDQKSEGKSESIFPRKDLNVLPSGTSELFGGNITEGRDCCYESELQQLQPSEKIKLQLFPINESTRLRLEKDGYNPFLELTLSAKKRIWSVIKHINTKWGNENGKWGKALLFPYDVNLEKLASYRRWSMEDTEISAREVYMSVNSPAVFRLRYGWFLDHQLEDFKMPLLSTHSDSRRQSEVSSQALNIQVNQMKESKIENKYFEKIKSTNEASDVVKEQMPSVEQVECVVKNLIGRESSNVPRMGNQLKADGIYESLVPWEDNLTNLSIGGLLSEVSLLGKIIKSETESASQMQPILAVSDFSVGGLLSEVSLQGKMNIGGLNSVKELDRQPLKLVSGVDTGCLLSQATLQGEIHDYIPPTQEFEMPRTIAGNNSHQKFPWDDSLTALSIGGLLSEASMQGKINNVNPSGNKSSLPQSSSTADSLGAFVATQLNSHLPDSKLQLHEPCTSFFDAEETCHAFPVRKVSPLSGMAVTASEAGSSMECQEVVRSKSEATAQGHDVQQSKTKLLPRSQGIVDEDSCNLALKGINWNDSLGPFDLGQPLWSPLTVGDNHFVNNISSVLQRLPPRKIGGDELVDGWPKWLVDNIPKDVLDGLQPKSADSYDKLSKVGQGTYSNVYKARDRNSGKIVALKKVRFDTSEPESVKFMAREIIILQKLNHPNIIKLEGVATSRMQYSLYLVFDFMPSDLSTIITRPDAAPLTEPQVKCYMQQLLSGLQHCHERGILHRDIKGSNLLIDKDGRLKIADFGLANSFQSKSKKPLTSRVVTLWYRAPELLSGATDYGVGVDLWSAGCLLAEMFHGRPIMPGRNEIEQLHKIFKLCGSPSEDYWKKAKLPASFRPAQPYKPSFHVALPDLPESSYACDLSGLPAMKVDVDVINSNDRRRSKTSRTKQSRRSREKSERRRPSITDLVKEEIASSKEEKQGDSSMQSQELEHSASSSASSISVKRSSRKREYPPSPPGFKFRSYDESSRTEAHPNALKNIKNYPILLASITEAAKHYEDNRLGYRRSISTVDFRDNDLQNISKFFGMENHHH
nr:probable serine/threonine-protein kinase At1g54610 [Ipomoea batatas]